ncbi:hypothetical protein HK098_005178 [Nowakowskiella sp. JEL0407]|nr:hypothetical protein HK098_005178 [Nowakowskiella sp. JEL0407]
MSKLPAVPLQSNISDSSYKPFPLAPSSSFSPAKLSTKSRKKISQTLKAKYDAYSLPNQSLVNSIEASCKRAKQSEKLEREKLSTLISNARQSLEKRKGNLDDCIGPVLARERMKNKLSEREKNRQLELQFLVEGQRNSIDAIRLKEFLSVRKSKLSFDEYTEKDRERVQDLIDA